MRTALWEWDFKETRILLVAIETVSVKAGKTQTMTSRDGHILASFPRSCNTQ